MERIFKEAHHKRRNKEYILTSLNTNCVYYGSPAYARKESIWPPLSEQGPLLGLDSDPRYLGRNQEYTRTGPTGPQSQSHSISVLVDLDQSVQAEDLSKAQQLTADRSLLYQPLHEGQIIRVLELQPGSPEEELRGNFHYTDLRCRDLNYDALSYVWGNDKFLRQTGDNHGCSILLQNDAFEAKITRNLDQALRHIRLVSKPILIWSDAVCIRQDDKHEQGHQVSLMGSVYKSAEKVIIWLGDNKVPSIWDKETNTRLVPPPEFEDVRAQRAFGVVCELVNRWLGPQSTSTRANYSTFASSLTSRQASENHTGFKDLPPVLAKCSDQNLIRKVLIGHYGISTQSDDLEESGHDNEIEDLQPPLDKGIDSDADGALKSQSWSSLVDLYTRPWFCRVWVIQEAVLAKRAVVRWANTWIDWHWVGLAAALLRTNHKEVCERLHLNGVYNAYLMYRLSPSSDLPAPELSFMDLLRLTRQFDVTDPRDRVYGLLGIKAKHNDPDTGSLFIQPDYTISPNQLWKRVAWKSIRAACNLSILSSVQYSTEQYDSEYLRHGRYGRFDFGGPTTRNAMCSWVPNWDLVYRTTLSPWDPSESFAAASGFPLCLENDLSSDTLPDRLKVHGCEAGVVGFEGLYMWREIDTSLLFTKHLGGFFASQAGIQLLAETFTAGRTSYGSLSGSSNQATSDFAAYLLMLHGNHKASHGELTNDATAAAVEDIYQESNFFKFYRKLNEPIKEKSLQRVFNAHPGLEEQLQVWAKHGDAERFLATAMGMCERRRLFLTCNGYLGLGSDTAKEGDILVVLSGADVPYLLRPVPNANREVNLTEAISSSTNAKTAPVSDYDDTPPAPPASSLDPKQEYLLIGECYVVGLMEGEAVRAAIHNQELVGPVQPDLIVAQILAQANMPEKIPGFATISEKERTRQKEERLQRGEVYTAESLERFTSLKAEKSVFHIR